MNKSKIKAIHIIFWVLSVLTVLMLFINTQIALGVFFLWWISLFFEMRASKAKRKERLQNYGDKIRMRQK